MPSGSRPGKGGMTCRWKPKAMSPIVEPARHLRKRRGRAYARRAIPRTPQGATGPHRRGRRSRHTCNSHRSIPAPIYLTTTNEHVESRTERTTKEGRAMSKHMTGASLDEENVSIISGWIRRAAEGVRQESPLDIHPAALDFAISSSVRNFDVRSNYS